MYKSLHHYLLVSVFWVFNCFVFLVFLSSFSLILSIMLGFGFLSGDQTLELLFISFCSLSALSIYLLYQFMGLIYYLLP